MRITRRRLLRQISVAAGGALVVACGPPAPQQAPPTTGQPSTPAKPSKPAGSSRPDELVLCWGTFQLQTHQLDPQTHVGTIAESQLRHIFEPLLQIDRDLQTVRPQLATEWQRLDDLTIRFKLRQNVKFHNGEDFDADAARFSILRPLDPANKADARTTYAGISRVDVVDKYTIDVKTAQPDPALLLRMTGFSMTMLAPRWAAQSPDVFTREAYGTGPYKLASWSDPLQDWTLVGNDQYWGGAPNIKKVRIKTIPELATRTAALRSGEVHVAKDVAVEEVDAINKSGRALAKATPSNRIPYYVMEVRKPPCNNKLLRQAINYAANLDGIIQSVLYGNATRVATTVAPWHVGFHPDLKPYPYDPDKARALMKEAGFPNGFDLNINFIQGRYMKDKEVAEAMAQELNKVGIRAKPVLREAALNTQEDLDQHLDGLIFASWGNWIFDADNQLFVRWHSSARDTANGGKGQSSLSYGNAEFDKLVEQARVELDPTRRLDLYKKAQEILYDDAAALFMWTLTDIYGVDNWVVWEPRKDEMVWAHEMAWNE
ncbi:MAG TPA: ABC transporter substrate-binding protein [Chloroflexota bacterium]|nr:ABC transporter substrate-binding protein [Chloroflexota bacterium]